jgi:hypothetical protein
MADNRTKRGFPKPKAETILTYPPRLSGFLDDDFGGRDFLIQTNSWLKADLLGVSTNREVVEIGKDDWLVYVEDEVREAVLREVYFTPDQLKQIRKMLVERQQWLRLRGCSFYLLVAPMSSYIYPEILPPGLVSCKPKNGLTTLLNFLKTTTDLHIIEPDSLLLAAKKHFDLYYKRDTHWNDVGAYIAYKDVISNIKQEFPAISPSLPLDRFRFTLPNYLGDLDRMLGVSESFKRPSIRLSLKQKNYTVVNETQNLSGIKHLYGSVHQYQHNLSPKLPKLYMNHDSYGDFLIEYLSEHFGQSTYEFVRAFEPESIEKYNPDIVIWEFVNRMASGLPKLRNARIENDLKAHGIIIDDAYFNRFNKTN